MYQSLFFNKVVQHGCLPVNFAEFLRTPFFIKHHNKGILETCSIMKFVENFAFIVLLKQIAEQSKDISTNF